MFQPLIVIYKGNNFFVNHWGCTSIYRSLYIPLKYLLDFDFMNVNILVLCKLYINSLALHDGNLNIFITIMQIYGIMKKQ